MCKSWVLFLKVSFPWFFLAPTHCRPVNAVTRYQRANLVHRTEVVVSVWQTNRTELAEFLKPGTHQLSSGPLSIRPLYLERNKLPLCLSYIISLRISSIL